MSRITCTTVIAAAALAAFAVPASASNDRASVPFFLAPFVQPAQPAYAPPLAYQREESPPVYRQRHAAYAPQYEERSAPRRSAPSTTREVVAYGGTHAAGTVIVNTTERRLYFVLGNGRAIRYAIGVGREGFQWAGQQRITNKQEWPDWRPPEEMLRRQPGLPRYMAGGPHNPLGARALYLGATLYRIHGSNEPETIGHAVSSGCIRMLNEDVVDLYDRVKVGTQVVVLR
jgi:lipoprotein-anchoring transpeptidase ErfK/SrfK